MHNKLKETRTVVNANTDTVVQRTMYYASGVPMAQSWGRVTQPYLYNGKEFVEGHGLNSYDYGFRGYYAPTGQLLRACNGDKPNTQGLPAGTYMVVYNSNNNSLTQKLVLQ